MNRLFSSSEIAQSALYFLIFGNILIFAIGNSFPTSILHHAGKTSIPSTIVSLFRHTDLTHLVENVFAIHGLGTTLFVHTSSRTRWQSIWIILNSHLICGTGAFALEFILRCPGYKRKAMLHIARNVNRCTHWLSDAVNDGDIASYVTDALAFVMKNYRLSNKLGASGVVYGWTGMTLVTTLFSPYHAEIRGLDFLTWVGVPAHSIYMISQRIQSLQPSKSVEDVLLSLVRDIRGMDIIAHFTAFTVGMVWALMILVCDFLWPIESRDEDVRAEVERVKRVRAGKKSTTRRSRAGPRRSSRLSRLQT